MARKSALERFNAKWTPCPATGCWLWLGALRKFGYGAFSVKDANIKQAHRASWHLHRGSIPQGMWVLHRCDVPSCVNPGHLFLGNAYDNMHDAFAKGRNLIDGTHNGRAKLTLEQVADIRTRRMKQKEFAALYGVRPPIISKILSGDRWKNVKTEPLAK